MNVPDLLASDLLLSLLEQVKQTKPVLSEESKVPHKIPNFEFEWQYHNKPAETSQNVYQKLRELMNPPKIQFKEASDRMVNVDPSRLVFATELMDIYHVFQSQSNKSKTDQEKRFAHRTAVMLAELFSRFDIISDSKCISQFSGLKVSEAKHEMLGFWDLSNPKYDFSIILHQVCNRVFRNSYQGLSVFFDQESETKIVSSMKPYVTKNLSSFHTTLTPSFNKIEFTACETVNYFYDTLSLLSGRELLPVVFIDARWDHTRHNLRTFRSDYDTNPFAVLHAAILHSILRIDTHGTVIMLLPKDLVQEIDPNTSMSKLEYIIQSIGGLFQRWTLWCSKLSVLHQEIFLILDNCLITGKIRNVEFLAKLFTYNMPPQLLPHQIFQDLKQSLKLDVSVYKITSADLSNEISKCLDTYYRHRSEIMNSLMNVANAVTREQVPEGIRKGIKDSYHELLEVLDKHGFVIMETNRKEHVDILSVDELEKMKTLFDEHLNLLNHSESRDCSISAMKALQLETDGGGWVIGGVGYRMKTGGKLGVLVMLDDDTYTFDLNAVNSNDKIYLEKKSEDKFVRVCYPELPRPFVADVVYYEDNQSIVILDIWFLGKNHMNREITERVYTLPLKDRMEVLDELYKIVSSKPGNGSTVFWGCNCRYSNLASLQQSVNWGMTDEEESEMDRKLGIGLETDDLYFNIAVQGKHKYDIGASEVWRIWNRGIWLPS